MPRLHQLLANQDSIKGQATKVRTDAKATAQKRHLFEESVQTFISNLPGVPPETIEQKDIQTTVINEVKELNKYVARSFDIGYQVDLANSQASADIVLDGVIFAKSVPVTAIMQMLHRTAEVKDSILGMPTRDPAKGFLPDPDRGHGIYKAREVKRIKTKKEDQPVIIVPATDKFPAQAVLKAYDVVTGYVLDQEWSSIISPSTKSELLDRCETWERALKEAKSIANEIEINVEGAKVGQRALDYIYKPLLSGAS